MRMASRRFALIGAAALALTLAGEAAAEGKNFDGQPVPDFAIESMSFGNEKGISDFAGQVVLLEFWFLG